MIITWNMYTFLVEGSFLHRTASAFFTSPLPGIREKNKYTANNLPCVKPCSFSAQRCGVYLSNVTLRTKAIFCPTHKYKRMYTEKSSTHVYADILNFCINFVVFEQFFHILRATERKTPPFIRKGCFCQHKNCATNGSVNTEKIVETKVY